MDKGITVLTILQANNISAQQIREDYLRRQREAEPDTAASGAQTPAEGDNNADSTENLADEIAEAAVETPSSSKKKGKGKEKATKEVKNKKKDTSKGKKRKSGSDDDDDEDWADIGRDMYKKAKKLPGQLENCEFCEKRFTVTPYTKTGPDGGLLCTPCGKELAKDAPTEKKPKASTAGRKRRKVESDRLDGRINVGAKSLQQMCIEKVAQHHQDLDELGDLPQDVVERLSEIFTKRRVMKPETLKLFLRGDLDRVVINDCACESQHDNLNGTS